jgi:FAD/FMN-containing dehydrogenase
MAAGGSISAEHGIGQMKLDDFVRLTDATRLNALRALKAAFDPLGLMNPGKLIPPGASDQASLASARRAP